MRRMKLLLALAGLINFVGGNTPTPKIKVIANATVKSDKISVNELKNVYLGRSSSFRDGTHVEPVLERQGAAHEEFLRQYLGQDSEQLHAYYRNLLLTRKVALPMEVNSDVEMVAYVARTRDAIGYVGADTNTEGLKTLSIEGATVRKLITRVEPEYPPILRKNHIGGIVCLSVTVATNGTVEKVRVLGGNPALAEPAEAAVKKWVYSPASVRESIEVEISFEAIR